MSWRDYDIQLTVYAVLLAATRAGDGLQPHDRPARRGDRGRLDVRPRACLGGASPSPSTRPATVFDYRWLRTLTWPIYVVNLALLAVTLLLGDADAASSRWISRARLPVPVQRAGQDRHDHRARALPGRPRAEARLAHLDPGSLPRDGTPVDPRDAPTRPRDVPRLLRDPGRDALHGRREPPLARGPRRGRHGGSAARLDLRPPRLPAGTPHELPRPRRRIRSARDSSC